MQKPRTEPSELVARPWLAVGLKLSATLVALLGVGSCLWDLLDSPLVRGSAASQAGQSAGHVIGMLFRTCLLAGVAAFLFVKARAFQDPERFGEAALTKRALRQIVATTRSRDIEEPTPAAGKYADHTDAEIAAIYGRIDPAKAPARHDELILEARHRLGTLDDHTAAG